MIKQLNRYFFLTLIFLNTSFLIAQGDYYISNALDTVFGEIKLSTNYSQKFLFKGKGQVNEEAFSPSEVIEFSDENHIYHSLRLEDSERNEFRELLVDGEVKLYLRRKSNDYISFIISKDGELNLLEQRTLLEDSKFVNKTRYLRILKLLLIDQPEIVRRVDQMKFNRQELSALIQDYNQYYDEPSTNYSKNKRKLDLFSSIEFSFHSKGFDSEDFNVDVTNALSDLNLSMSFFAGIQNFKGQELSVGLEVSKFSGMLSRRYSLGEENRSFNNLLLNVPIRLNFKFGNKKFKPIIFGELVFSQFLSKEYDLDLFDLSGDLITTDMGSVLSSRTIGFKLGVGAFINANFYAHVKYGSLRFDYLPNNSIENLLLNPITLSVGYKL